MAYRGAIDDVRTIAQLGVPSRVPVFALSEEFDVRWYGRGTYEEIVLDAEKLAACTAAAIREFDYDWAWLQVDDCIEFEPLGVGPGVDIAQAKEATRGKVALMGNLDPIAVLERGTPEQVAAEAERIVTLGKQGGGYLFDTGEMVPRDTPEANVRAMIDAARRLGGD